MILCDKNDTICALATTPGIAAIGVIRLSGDKAISICDKVFASAKGEKKLITQKSHTIHYGTIKKGKEIIDEVLVSIFKNPNSYTGEDLIEVSCHGSSFVQQEIIRLFINEGARAAKPGEFTQRAFLNGKMDLSQAEAVADLISSNSEASHRVAIQQMRGGFSQEIKLLREKLVNFASLIELELDFSEEDVEFTDREDLKSLLLKIHKIIQRLTDSFRLGNVIKNGIPVVIAGKPNVGKSTLLNVLLNEERAIVTDIPGTTRDAIEDVINLGGVVFRFIDTAGIRDTSDALEQIGVNRTFEKIKTSALILYIFDVNEITLQELEGIISGINSKINDPNTKILLIGNKIDIADMANVRKKFKKPDNIVFISAKEKRNIDILIEKLTDMLNLGDLDPGETIITNARHYEALSKADAGIMSVHEGLNNNITGDLLAIDIRHALHHLGEITGEITTDELLGNIFERFCIGK
ncbi:MAG: tRNA uridine-5-carboxymethylaminomethyl(34) synthesis GTPase MnmE [Bacteroidota bacterium]